MQIFIYFLIAFIAPLTYGNDSEIDGKLFKQYCNNKFLTGFYGNYKIGENVAKCAVVLKNSTCTAVSAFKGNIVKGIFSKLNVYFYGRYKENGQDYGLAKVPISSNKELEEHCENVPEIQILAYHYLDYQKYINYEKKIEIVYVDWYVVIHYINFNNLN